MEEKLSLKDIRLKTGMSIYSFSRAFGIEEAVLNSWEKLKPAPKPYIVNMIYELCVYRGYFQLDINVDELRSKDEKTFTVSTTQAMGRLLTRMARLTNDAFIDAFNADDFPRCYELIDTQVKLRRLEPSDAEKLNKYISAMDV